MNAQNEMLTARRNQLEATANRLDEIAFLYERAAADTLREALEFCEK